MKVLFYELKSEKSNEEHIQKLFKITHALRTMVVLNLCAFLEPSLDIPSLLKVLKANNYTIRPTKFSPSMND